MNRNYPYEGKYFSILGDSISTLDGCNPPECAVFYDWANQCAAGIFTPEDTWWGQVIHAVGGRLLVNHSFAGSTVSKRGQYQIESYGCSDGRTGALGIGALAPDVVMILLGLNDWGYGTPMEPDDEKKGLFAFSSAYEAMLEKIKKNYPEAEVWCLTLPRSCLRRDRDFVIPERFSGGHIYEYCRAIRACGETTGCKVVDIYCPGDPYDTIDGYHPTAEGMKTISAAVLRQIGWEVP